MPQFLISFPGEAMQLSPDEFEQAGKDANAVVDELKEAGVLVFAAGIDETTDPVMVAADGTVTSETYPQTKEFNGGLTVVDVQSRDEALKWAAKIATACRCSQEVRAVF